MEIFYLCFGEVQQPKLQFYYDLQKRDTLKQILMRHYLFTSLLLDSLINRV